MNEASLLLGFLIQDRIDFSVPDTPEHLTEMKKQTYTLMNDLHQSFYVPFVEKFKKALEHEHKTEDYRAEQKDFFGKGDMLMESIFYSGTGVYDFQYFQFLEQKYKYDEEWLLDKQGFDFIQAKAIVSQIKNILQKKTRIIRFYSLKERLQSIIDDMKKKDPSRDWEKELNEILPAMELHQYVELFFENNQPEDSWSKENIREKGWQSFYKNLIELFVVNKSDFDENLDTDVFMDKFSTTPKKGLNLQFETIGNYNLINSHPIIKLDNQRYFVPIPFLLYEAIYESPFYWMTSSEGYRDQAGRNRGNVGEEITHELLSKVFAPGKIYRSIKITTKKGLDDTDVDVLCVLGSKALCVQVKSKKLTLLSRNGDDKQLQKDFNSAVQDAYGQGLIARQKILDKGSKFKDRDGNNITLSEEIDEVYLMGITTENYPSLAFQSNIMLDKKDDDPFPIILTIFDLELLVHYLADPYDLLYYIKQRTSLMDYFIADEEAVYLGYHLMHKLWKTSETNLFALDTSFAKLIDRNYYPFKAGLAVSDKGDAIKTRWKNEDFDHLCKELKGSNQAKITDIIFQLFDESGKAREDLVRLLKETKQKTLHDNQNHDFVLLPNENDFRRVGITYISISSDRHDELIKKLLFFCQVRKYICKAGVWMGFGSLRNSRNMIDAVAFNNEPWRHDDELEKLSKSFLENKTGQFIRLKKKVGRNDPCPCGSGKKYKKCCGR
ncbi:MAG: SEC-C metal-binding domain-containing protein [Syntrophorhabdaceae bacterium]